MSFDANRIKEIGAAFEEKLIAYRRHLHENAELSFEEYETNRWIHKKLSQINVTFKENIRGNSIVAVFESNKPGPFIGFRADIDALPITEDNGLAFASRNTGVMHACGHDAHAAVLLALAEALAENPDLVKGKVAFIFQQGEELLPGGAKMVIEDGGLAGLDCIYAYHVRTNLNTGQFDAEPGIRSCGVQAYEVEIEGKGGHTGFPHLARDPIAAASAVISEIYQIVPQNIGPRETATISVSFIHSNNAASHNVFSQSVKFGGTIRTLNNDLLTEIPEIMEKKIEGVCGPRGCKGKLTIFPGYAAVVNDDTHYAIVAEAGEKLGYENQPMDDIMGAEDFSFMLQEKPGAYFTVGMRNQDVPGSGGDRHTPNLMLDEAGIRVAFELMLGTYVNTLAHLEG